MVRKYRRAIHQTKILELLEDRQLLSADVSQGVLLSALAQMPLSFQPSHSATNEIQYLANTGEYSVALDSTGATLQMSGSNSAVRLSLIGSASSAVATGEDPLAGTTNQFIGNNPSDWSTAASSYSRVTYSNVYSGIDLTYYGNQGHLEYDFTVAPGASPSAIHLNVSGGSASLDASGNLVIHTSAGDLVEQAPTLYQDVAGARVPVAGHYTLGANGDVGFSVGTYDTTKPLVIDPVLAFSSASKLANGSAFSSYNVAVDAGHNLYVVGTVGSGQGQSREIVLAKFDPNGKLIYSTTFGGTADNVGLGIAVDAAGDAYVTGYTSAADFPTTAGAYQPTRTGTSGDGYHAFVTKFDPTGSTMLYSTYLTGTTSSNSATGIAVDQYGHVFVAGYMESAGFPTTPGAYRTTPASSFVAELSTDGSSLIYSTYLGTDSFQDFAYDLALDSNGAVYVVGQTSSSDYPTTTGAANPTYDHSSLEGFVTKLNPTGTGIEYSTFINNAYPNSIAVDSSGSAYVTGNAPPTFATTSGAFQRTGSASDVIPFILKLNPTGTAFGYATFLGNSASAGQIAVDPNGAAVVVGGTSSPNFPTTPDVPQSTLISATNVFVTKLNPTGTGLIFSTYLGGQSTDVGSGVAVDEQGNVYVAALSSVAKILVLDASVTTITAKPNPAGIGQAITLTANVQGSGTQKPTGTVTFFDGLTAIGTAQLDATGKATFTISTLTLGAHNITASYSGDSNVSAGATISSTLVTVAQATTTTTLTTSSPTNSSVFGQAIAFTANVKQSDSKLPTGTVTFFDGSTSIGSSGLDANGNAVLTISTLSAGTHNITATYGGNGNVVSSTTASPTVVTVAPATTTTTLTTSPATVAPFTPVALTAVVAASSGLAATGSVAFYLNGTVIGQVGLTNGSATLNLPNLAIGANAVMAIYQGDANDSASSSSVATVQVGNKTEQFINAVYLQLLNQTVDAASLGVWEGLLNKGTSPTKFVTAIAKMPQARIVAIQNAYAQYLGTSPTPDQITAALKLKAFSSSAVAAQILGSPTYYQKAGATAAGFFSALSRDVLHGAPVPASIVKSATRSIASQTSRTKAVQSLQRTTPARVAAINDVYVKILGRAASAAEVKKFLKQFNKGATTDTLVTTLLSTPEYISRFPGNGAK